MHRYHLNIAGIENYTNLQDVLPHCWSEPSLGNYLRRELEPPLLQQAAFDDTVSLNQIRPPPPFHLSLTPIVSTHTPRTDLSHGHHTEH